MVRGSAERWNGKSNRRRRKNTKGSRKKKNQRISPKRKESEDAWAMEEGKH